MRGIGALFAFEIDHAVSTRIIIRAILAPKALERGRRFDQRAVHGEVLIRQKLLLSSALDRRVQRQLEFLMATIVFADWSRRS